MVLATSTARQKFRDGIVTLVRLPLLTLGLLGGEPVFQSCRLQWKMLGLPAFKSTLRGFKRGSVVKRVLC